MREKCKVFWNEYRKSINWTAVAIWFILLNLLFWDKWNISKFFILIGFFAFVTLYIWFRVKYLPEKPVKKKTE